MTAQGQQNPSQAWIIAGPTASGKSGLAVELARECDGVVINADSMQIYAEIPIITAQPDREERGGIEHLLYGFQPVMQNYSAADWALRAADTMREVHAQGRQPILVGGSGLYLKALIEGFSPMPVVPMATRRQITDLYDMLGPQGFYDALKKIDPETAARLHPTDRQRCIRAREVYEVSGEPISSWQKQPKEAPAADISFKTIVLLPDRDWLYGRINKRFRRMIDQGALDEARRMQEIDLPSDATSARAVGLQALRDHLERKITLDEAIEQGQAQSRQYAKRQYTWFRRQALPKTKIPEGAAAQWLDQARRYFLGT